MVHYIPLSTFQCCLAITIICFQLFNNNSVRNSITIRVFQSSCPKFPGNLSSIFSLSGLIRCLPRHVSRSCIGLFYSVSTILWWLVHITALCRTFLLLLFNNIPLRAFTVSKLRQMCIISTLWWLWIRLRVCNYRTCIYSNDVCVQLSDPLSVPLVMYLQKWIWWITCYFMFKHF